MTDPELNIADVMDLSPVQVDDTGRLFNDRFASFLETL